ncbi:hypothetical protein R83H12_01480 [Fibrobacteria bacterium R8-3-H12]
MKNLLPVVIFVLMSFGTAFSESGLEFDLGYFSPNKGVVGIRYSPATALSFGFIWGGPFSNYTDFGIAGSFHFLSDKGPYVFQSHHWLNSKVGNMWEINTGGGYQFLFLKRILVYAEVGIPFYIGGWQVWRYYDNGIPYNRSAGDLVLTSFRAGLGVGYIFRFL